MTQEELDALPTSHPIYGEHFALYHGPDDPIFIFDSYGVEWTVGWADGVRYKLRRNGLFA